MREMEKGKVHEEFQKNHGSDHHGSDGAEYDKSGSVC
jgi:hypothetical protein